MNTKCGFRFSLCYLLLILFSCKVSQNRMYFEWTPYEESTQLLAAKNHVNDRMKFKLIQSRVLDKNIILSQIQDQLSDFNSHSYNSLKPLIFEKSIIGLQNEIAAGNLTYKLLTQWYLYRIALIESDIDLFLNGLISINPKAVVQADSLDRISKTNKNHKIYGMPILVKDNINTYDMKTTAGSVALIDNQTQDAYIISRLRSKGAIILGKANLSEWAYYLCKGCPLGYSALGGQTLNPYGRMVFETGGSSAGSGVVIAANMCVAAIGTETSGSILSPSSKNSIVGMKPTVGLFSRTGIIPISHNLDTPGPMTKTIEDNIIVLSAMKGKDDQDQLSFENDIDFDNLVAHEKSNLTLGVNTNYFKDSLYANAVANLQKEGIKLVEFSPTKLDFSGFSIFLNYDMKRDLPKYMKEHSSVDFESVRDLVSYNNGDSTLRIPYGQFHFVNTANESFTEAEFDSLELQFITECSSYFDVPMLENNVDAVLSINNWDAGAAAMAKYPCLTIPMGYKKSGEPANLTLICRHREDENLLRIGLALEQILDARVTPKKYK